MHPATALYNQKTLVRVPSIAGISGTRYLLFPAFIFVKIGGEELEIGKGLPKRFRRRFVVHVSNRSANAVFLFGEQARDDVSGYESRSAGDENERELRHLADRGRLCSGFYPECVRMRQSLLLHRMRHTESLIICNCLVLVLSTLEACHLWDNLMFNKAVCCVDGALFCCCRLDAQIFFCLHQKIRARCQIYSKTLPENFRISHNFLSTSRPSSL